MHRSGAAVTAASPGILTMPETLPQWLWFTFFFVGSLGGWLAAGLAIWWAFETFKIQAFIEKMKE